MTKTKRTIALLILTLLNVFALCAVALAEAAGGVTQDAPYTWAVIGTIAGATAATLLIVQYIKAPIDKVGHIPTRLLVYLIAFILLLGVQAFTTGLTLSAIPLILVNAFVVALAAMGSYEATFAKRDAKAMEPPDDPDNPA